MDQWLSIKGKRFSTILGKKERFRSFVFVFALFIVYLFIFSESGLLERLKLNREYDLVKIRINRLENDNRILSDTIGKYSAGQYSEKDIIASGYVYGQGKVIHYPDSKSAVPVDVTSGSIFELELSHLRIIWIIFSVVLAMYYFTRKKGEAQNNEWQ